MSYSPPPPRIPESDITKSHIASHTDKWKRRRKIIQLRWQASSILRKWQRNAPRGAEAKWQRVSVYGCGRQKLSELTLRSTGLWIFHSLGTVWFFLLFRIHFKAMWNLLNKWQLILEEDLSKYLHVRRREQKVAILERFFYQKLSKSIFIRIIRILSANRKVKSPNSHNYYFLSLLKTAISIQRLLLVQHKLTSLLPGMPRLITQHCFKPLKERKNKEYF